MGHDFVSWLKELQPGVWLAAQEGSMRKERKKAVRGADFTAQPSANLEIRIDDQCSAQFSKLIAKKARCRWCQE